MTAGCIVAAVFITACGGTEDDLPDEPSPPSSSPPPPSGSNPVSIQGTERLAWDQNMAPGTSAANYSFILYIDGVQGTLSNVTCANQSGSSVSCNGRLNGLSAGNHYLQVASVVNGRESAPSIYLAVSVSNRLAASEIEAAPGTGGAADCGALARVCFQTVGMWEWQVPVSAPRATPDGRLFLIEEGRRVRVLAGDSVRHEPALVADESRRLVDLVVDRDFASTGAVYALWVENADPATVSVSRFREVGDTLGEEAVVVSGVSFDGKADPFLVQDGQRLLYLAVSGAPAFRGSRRQSTILRVTADGAVPWSSGQRSLVWREVLRHPVALTIDDAGQRLWLGGMNEQDRSDLLAFEIAGSQGERVLPIGVSAAAASTQSVPATPVRLMIVDDRGGLWSSETGLATDLQRVPFDLGEPLAVSAGLSGDFYLVTAIGMQTQRTFVLVHLIPQLPEQLLRTR